VLWKKGRFEEVKTLYMGGEITVKCILTEHKTSFAFKEKRESDKCNGRNEKYGLEGADDEIRETGDEKSPIQGQRTMTLAGVEVPWVLRIGPGKWPLQG